MEIKELGELVLWEGRDGNAWRIWRDGFLNYMVAAGFGGVSEKRKKALMKHMIGVEGRRVLSVLEELPEGATLSDLIDQLDHFFRDRESALVKLLAFDGLEQGESGVSEWMMKVREVASDCELGQMFDRMCMAQFVKGLRNKDLKRKILALETPTLEKVMNLGLIWEKHHQTEEKEICVQEKLDPDVAVVNNRGRGYVDSDNIRCYRCQKTGHIAKFCRGDRSGRVIRCFKCNEEGHTVAQCKGQKQGNLNSLGEWENAQ